MAGEWMCLLATATFWITGSRAYSPGSLAAMCRTACSPASGWSGPPGCPGGRSEERTTARAEASSTSLTGVPAASRSWVRATKGSGGVSSTKRPIDALVVDMQHGLTDMNDVWPMLQAISQTDTVPVVRVPWNDPATIMKVLDFGAYGVLVPLINTAEDAKKAVAACRYPPVGIRSSGPIRAVHYGGADHLGKANHENVGVGVIETKEGVPHPHASCAPPRRPPRHLRPPPPPLPPRP